MMIEKNFSHPTSYNIAFGVSVARYKSRQWLFIEWLLSYIEVVDTGVFILLVWGKNNTREVAMIDSVGVFLGFKDN